MYSDLATLKAALSITDSSRDTLLTLALNTASEQIDTIAGRTFTVLAENQPMLRLMRSMGFEVRRDPESGWAAFRPRPSPPSRPETNRRAGQVVNRP